VLDGTPSRMAQAERFAAALSGPPGPPAERLLIRTPASRPPPQPLPELLEGFDTATQITALAGWLQRQPGPLPSSVWIATNPQHTARAVLLARIALGPLGITVAPPSPPPPSTRERPKLWRDALRLTLWRATGSTGTWLVPQLAAQKRQSSGL